MLTILLPCCSMPLMQWCTCFHARCDKTAPITWLCSSLARASAAHHQLISRYMATHECPVNCVLHFGVLPQMTGGSNDVVFGRCDPATWHPDLDWLEGAVAGPSPPRMVVLINPCNPTGARRRSLAHRWGNVAAVPEEVQQHAASRHAARRLAAQVQSLYSLQHGLRMCTAC